MMDRFRYEESQRAGGLLGGVFASLLAGVEPRYDLGALGRGQRTRVVHGPRISGTKNALA